MGGDELLILVKDYKSRIVKRDLVDQQNGLLIIVVVVVLVVVKNIDVNIPCFDQSRGVKVFGDEYLRNVPAAKPKIREYVAAQQHQILRRLVT